MKDESIMTWNNIKSWGDSSSPIHTFVVQQAIVIQPWKQDMTVAQATWHGYIVSALLYNLYHARRMAGNMYIDNLWHIWFHPWREQSHNDHDVNNSTGESGGVGGEPGGEFTLCCLEAEESDMISVLFCMDISSGTRASLCCEVLWHLNCHSE